MTKTRLVKVGQGQSISLFGGGEFQLIAGPCSVESTRTLIDSGQILKELKVPLFRGGVYKMRTSPNTFQGLGEEIWGELKSFKETFNLSVVVEITDLRLLPAYIDAVDLIQVGSRNMYNYPLLTELGRTQVPVLLKRAFSATFDEWIGACQYLEKGGNRNVILCERGIRTFEPRLRNTLDLGMVALLKTETNYPVVVDPSHAAGRKDLVIPLSKAAKAVGADGLLVEFHPHPENALSDREQALNSAELKQLILSIESLP